jgi:hypothetical protein
MEYTTMPQVMDRLKDRFIPVEEDEAAAASELAGGDDSLV